MPENAFQGFFSKSNVPNIKPIESNIVEHTNGFAPFQNQDADKNSKSDIRFLDSITKIQKKASSFEYNDPSMIEFPDRIEDPLNNPLPGAFNELIQSIEINNCPKQFMLDSGRFGGLSGSIQFGNQFGNILERSFPDLASNLGGAFENGMEALIEPKKEKTNIIT